MNMITRATVQSRALAAALGAMLVCSGVQPTLAQVTTPPVLGPAPRLVLPRVERASLPNGLTILVSRNAEVPIVEGRLLIGGGARLTPAPSGLASFAASALMEGAGGRTAVELAQAVDLLGANISARAGWDDFVVSVRAPKRTIDRALALAADVALRPTFAVAAVDRLRGLRLAGFLAARDQPTAVASKVFWRNVFPVTHPFHDQIIGDSASVAGFDSAAVQHFWTRAIDPHRSSLIVTGDVTLPEAVAWARKYFGAWKTPTNPLMFPAAARVPRAPRQTTRVILVDKPGAAQSVIQIGAPGAVRTSPDYPAIELMNTILGGSFSSRLNDILREQRGYTYGAGSSFGWLPVPGPFVASAQVRTNVTDSSLAVFFRELRRMRDEPVSPLELARGKAYVVLGALGNYETAGDVANAIAQSRLFGRALSAIAADYSAIEALTAAQVQHAAERYYDPAHLTVVVVGDLAVIRPGIERLGLGPIEVQKY